MTLHYKPGLLSDLEKLKQLALVAWGPFQNDLTPENWKKLLQIISSEDTFLELLQMSDCILCETPDHQVIGMAFLVPQGNPTDIYDQQWSYIRMVSVNPLFGGQGIGKQLTQKCIDLAIQNKEQTIALHTSEMMNTARHIYDSFGFKILREIEPRLGKRYWLYTLELVGDRQYPLT